MIDPGSTSQFLTSLNCNTSIVYDVNDDGTVNSEDLDYLIISIINNNVLNVVGDFNYDDSMDIYDILTLSDYLQ